ncbi:ABC transporter permease [Leekyejoonella antrihumi]|uniref:ABC transporter permease n=1 Tax=Leekyejoonella antrihumi TaxID=1660198 RepID=A0A563DYG7_9MICO|nr:ABC-2 family transporter protein [Leekyejoonella antrihumi]TWP34724.1 ABC transporter permease [Leekyejoonella antrihumi]
MRIYGRLLHAGIRQQSTYRLAALGGLIANATFGFLKVAMLFATVRAAGGTLHGYDIGSMSTYIWLSQGMLGSINLNGRTDFSDRIKTGDVAIDFIRPLNVQGAHVATELGRSIWALIPRGVPSILIGAVVVGMTVPSTPLPYLAGICSLLLGFVISATAVYSLGTAGFWLIETHGIQTLYMVVSGFLAGLFVPIYLFPHWLLAVAEVTPFPSMLMYPTNILSGRTTGVDTVALLAQQVFWLGVTVLVGHALTVRGRRKLEVQGG